MAMKVGNKGSLRTEINVTPLVDVVLVLLIIFMVVTPLLEKEMPVKVPDIEPEETPPDQIPPDQVVVQIRNGGRIYINQDEIKDADLGPRLTQLNEHRTDKIVFFDAEDSANYGKAVAVLDTIKASGTTVIGMMMPDPSLPPAPGGAPARP
jgi:biopolymer transport protein ExbD